MSLLSRLKQYFFAGGYPLKETPPEHAYNLLSVNYDNQPHNLMMALDEQLFTELIYHVPVQHKTIADIGCGTGRHWQKIMDQQPLKLLGYDVSRGMLDKLQHKFPDAQTFQPQNDRLPELPDASCDLIISTLTIGYIKNIEQALEEWCRVLKTGGEMIITDYHPDALAKGGNRTFRHNTKLIAIKNYIHPVDKVKEIAGHLRLEILKIREIPVDDTMRPYYEKYNALATFSRFNGTPIIYGIHLKKTDAIM